MKSNRITIAHGVYIACFLLLGSICSNLRAQTYPAHRAIFTAKTGTNFAFGSVPIGHAVQKTFSFTNTGKDTLFLQSLELNADSAFTIQFATLTIPPVAVGKVIVQFAPNSPRACSGTIAFDVAGGTASPTLKLSGNGAPAEAGAGSFLSTTESRDSARRLR